MALLLQFVNNLSDIGVFCQIRCRTCFSKLLYRVEVVHCRANKNQTFETSKPQSRCDLCPIKLALFVLYILIEDTHDS